jgi:light-regulated signal transduction histidine kinase (bacteriophytochrome)
MHKVLERQVKRHLKPELLADPSVAKLLTAVSDAFDHYDEHVKLTERSLELSSAELNDANAQLETHIGVVTQKTAELEAARRELEGANTELREFAYVVSHDLKAPLRAISSLASWIAADYRDVLDDVGREQLDLMLGRVRRMQALIDGILQYSRLGRVREEVETVNLDDLLAQIIDSLAPPDHIRVTVQPGLPTVTAERTRLQQVFQNLVSNAIKYMDKPQGDIEVTCQERADGWEFAVRDTGPGIDSRYYAKIFQIFQTLSPRDQVESTGVGLALVKKIVEMHGGHIWVESTVGSGSTFRFTMPRSSPILAVTVEASA